MTTTTASRIERRPFASLGHADHGWLNARHHFSFADYYDDERMHWGAIRVWNDDEIGPRSGFPPHPHSDMEIITYVRTGAITHQDSLGNKGRTGAGDVQGMSAGRLAPLTRMPWRRGWRPESSEVCAGPVIAAGENAWRNTRLRAARREMISPAW